MSTNVDDHDSIETNPGRVVDPGFWVGAASGKRDDQNEAVARFAAELAERFPNHEIEIRFNTNKLGGGAWLKNNGRNAQIGLGADLVAPPWYVEKREKSLYADGEKPKSLKYVDPDELELRYTVNMKTPATDEYWCNRNTDREDRTSYVYKKFRSFEAAWGYFTRHLNEDGVRPPSDE